MKIHEEKLAVAGPVGNIEVLMERPDAPRGIALVAHPHPFGGGANTNKVAHTLAKTFVALGYAAFRRGGIAVRCATLPQSAFSAQSSRSARA